MKSSTLLLVALGGIGLILLGRSSAAQAAPAPTPQPQPLPFPPPAPFPPPPLPFPTPPSPVDPVGTMVRVGDSVVVPTALAFAGVPGVAIPTGAMALGGAVRVLVSEIAVFGLRGSATAYRSGDLVAGTWTELPAPIPTAYFPASGVESVVLRTT